MKEINISTVIGKKRKEKGITQDELAEYMGVSKASVSKWETGQSYPDITSLPQLAAYFNISLDELVGYSPQMTANDISKTYRELSARFACEDFKTVLTDCRGVVKKYYSCFPLLMQMVVLLFNHYMLLPDGEEKNGLLREIADLCVRVRTESGDVRLSKNTVSIEASCRLLLGEPQSVLELLGENVEPRMPGMPVESLIAQAYAVMGKPEKAKSIMQISAYQNLLVFFESITSYISFCMDDFEKAARVLNMSLAAVEAVKLEELDPNSAVLLYAVGAQLYCLNNDTANAIKMLWKYTDLCTKRFFPLKLGGDFVDPGCIEAWLAESDIRAEIPRSEKVIKESMFNDIVLGLGSLSAPLRDNPEYQKIVEIFTKFVEEN